MQHKELTWTFMDKSGWGDGPWQHEPDKVQFYDPNTGYTCMIIRNHRGALCGYVGVPEWHSCYKKNYSVPTVRVHGSLNYSRHSNGHAHIPYPEEPENLWWFGFDCSHSRDLSPALPTILIEDTTPEGVLMRQIFVKISSRQIYRDLQYVKEECLSLAKQLKEIELKNE